MAGDAAQWLSIYVAHAWGAGFNLSTAKKKSLMLIIQPLLIGEKALTH
jgi:hypothetical protein